MRSESRKSSALRKRNHTLLPSFRYRCRLWRASPRAISVYLLPLRLGEPRVSKLRNGHVILTTPGMSFAQAGGRMLPSLNIWGSVSLSVQPEGQGRSEPPKIAWGSDIFSRSGRDLKARSSAKLNSHTSSESYSMSRPLLCTESETDPINIYLPIEFGIVTEYPFLTEG
jgi:hypothetical protein